MKALCVQQPWASLICLGVKDIENRSWKPKATPDKLLIVASSKKLPQDWVDKYFPVDCDNYFEVIQAMDMGILSRESKDLPTSAIVGYVEIDSYSDEASSCWGYTGDGNINWKLKNPRLFKTPIPFPKGKLHIFDIPEIDENNLPETIDVPYYRLEGDTLHAPVSEANFDLIMTQEKVFCPVLLTRKVEELLTTEDEKGLLHPIPVKTVSIESKTRTHVIDVKSIDFRNNAQQDGTPIEYEDWQGSEVQLYSIIYDTLSSDQTNDAKEEAPE